MINLRSLTDRELVREAEMHTTVPREMVAELLYRLRRSVGQTNEPHPHDGRERTGDIIGNNVGMVRVDGVNVRPRNYKEGATYTGRLPHVRK